MEAWTGWKVMAHEVDCILKFMEFHSREKWVQLQGVLPRQPANLSLITVAEVQKAYTGNDLWIIAVVDFLEQFPDAHS